MRVGHHSLQQVLIQLRSLEWEHLSYQINFHRKLILAIFIMLTVFTAVIASIVSEYHFLVSLIDINDILYHIVFRLSLFVCWFVCFFSI